MLTALLPSGIPALNKSVVFTDNPMSMLILLLLLTFGISGLIIYLISRRGMVKK